ncbi:MAG: radical SAM protein [Candidatus Omnitrophica bacterium]|nr:radical SAM protein [Candidatus Omnitrophota bacterium]MCM8806823.1 radical SAM protein [Candidatus Omnitrophota bacterium]
MEKKITYIEEVKSNKKIHNWYPGRRECTSERILLNPYIGCEVECFFCYALGYPGNFQKFRKEKKIYIYKNFVENLKEQIDKLNIVFCGYLSPVTEPFQEVEKIYCLSERTIKLFVEKNIPIEFITKSVIPESIIELIKMQKHSFGQVSILTPNEDIRKVLMKKGATTSELFENIRNLAKNGIFAVCRIDPIIPFITDNKKELEIVIKRAIDNGAKHIVASIMDIPVLIKSDIMNYIKKKFGNEIWQKIETLYIERIGNYLHANINYRREIFTFLREVCDKLNITFALCMEYEIKNGKVIGLNKEFMTSFNCEGIDIPVYFRKNDKFYPFTCKGNCLNCKKGNCGIPELAQGKKNENFDGWNYYDYLRWNKIIEKEKLL